MRFGLFIPQGWRLDLVDIAHREPVAGDARPRRPTPTTATWDSLWVYDHFHTVPVPTGEATHEAWSLMSAYAATTSRIKLGQMCTAMSYRNPVYLAKVAATADIISGGRIQMGIGGGWYEHEWRAYGYGFPSAGVRLARLDEGVQIMRDAWRDGVVSFDGQALPGRRRDCAAEAVAGRRDSAVDRRRRRKGDAAHRREVRAVHQLHLRTRGLRAQVAGARRALQGRGHRLRRDRAIGQLQCGRRRRRRPTSRTAWTGCGRG